MGTKLWDMQSKGAKTTSPKAIGKELVTLFKNFRSEMKFSYFLLFMGGVSNTVRLNNTINIFDISNIKPEAINKIKEGLLEESKEKTYIDHHSITDEEINTFLGKVQFIIDDKKPSEYVKSIVNVHPRIIPNEDTLNAIFNEIRDQQSSKKILVLLKTLLLRPVLKPLISVTI